MDHPADDLDLQSDSPTFAWTPPSQPTQAGTTSHDGHKRPVQLSHEPTEPKTLSPPPQRPYIDPTTLPGRPKSLSDISLRAFLLGATSGAGAVLTLYLILVMPHPLWRIPFFLSVLALFHFLEFWITARYNTRHANVSAFLLSSNGTAYNIAHTAAVAECVLANTLLVPRAGWLVRPWSTWVTCAGLSMIVVGQTCRSVAMVHAGSNFNHTVQTRRDEAHQLVTTGIYAWLRHPSYFGFFWWGIGTQVVLANRICLIGYIVILWQFFSRRIMSTSYF